MTQPTERVRGGAWMKIRREQMERQPLCQACLAADIVKVMDEVDHIVPLHKGGHATDPSNLQSLCLPCHAAKSAADEGKRVKAEIGLDGWPV